MISLRPYQSDIIERVRALLAAGKRRILIQLATGGGKTAIASFIASGAKQKGKRTWFQAHRDFLLDQTALTFDSVGLPYGFIAAGRPFNPHHAVHIGSVGTIQRRLAKLTAPDVFIWDEVKHIAAASWSSIFKWAPHSIHIGLDATPWRLDGRGLDDYFEAMVCGPSVSELMSAGYLSQYRAFAPSAPNLTDVHTIAGDYNRGELGHVMDDGQIIGDMVRHYRERADGKRAVFFGVGIDHSKHIANTFCGAGIPCCHIDGDSSSEERRIAALKLARGELRIISNVDIASEGFDLSAQAGSECPIECVGLARPTKSLSLHLQQIGRSLRPKGEPAVILDFAGNLLRHGLPDHDRAWSLRGIDRRTKAGREGPAVTQCGRCFGVHRAGLMGCPYCGEARVLQAREVEEVAGELREIDRSQPQLFVTGGRFEAISPGRALAAQQRREREKAEQLAAKSTAELIQLARKRGYRNPGFWAINVMKGRAQHG